MKPSYLLLLLLGLSLSLAEVDKTERPIIGRPTEHAHYVHLYVNVFLLSS
jgi:hypothetical protein